MALYVSEITSNGNNYIVLDWHVGTPFPISLAKVYSPHVLIELQADGDELEYIKSIFDNGQGFSIPMPAKRVIRWYGDIARTIIGNL